jgi:hypothetical protein
MKGTDLWTPSNMSIRNDYFYNFYLGYFDMSTSHFIYDLQFSRKIPSTLTICDVALKAILVHGKKCQLSARK